MREDGYGITRQAEAGGQVAPMGEWLTLAAERVLYADDGKERVLCDRLPSPVTLVVRLAGPDDKTIERVARAICRPIYAKMHRDWGPEIVEQYVEINWANHIDQASAAIAALSTPTERDGKDG